MALAGVLALSACSSDDDNDTENMLTDSGSLTEGVSITLRNTLMTAMHIIGFIKH